MIAKLRYSDQARWADAHRVDVLDAQDAIDIAKGIMGCFQLNWVDIQVGSGEIFSLYANEAMQRNREMAIRHGVAGS